MNELSLNAYTYIDRKDYGLIGVHFVFNSQSLENNGDRSLHRA